MSYLAFTLPSLMPNLSITSVTTSTPLHTFKKSTLLISFIPPSSISSASTLRNPIQKV